MCGLTSENGGTKRRLCPICMLNTVSHSVGALNVVCEPCADRMLECEHPSGESFQQYDGDGGGYKVWRCNSCSFTNFDMV